MSEMLWNFSPTHLFDLFPMVLAATALGLAVARPRLQPVRVRSRG